MTSNPHVDLRGNGISLIRTMYRDGELSTRLFLVGILTRNQL